MKDNFYDLLKASNAYGLIKTDKARGLGHAYLIISADDDTLLEFFKLIASDLLCQTGNACGKCRPCLQVESGNHPDVFFVNSERVRIKVAEIRELTLNAGIKALGNRKLYFIERAELMNADAQNKLLKTLEEPPAGVSVFLGASNEAGLLDTIKSRCRIIYLDKFDYHQIRAALVKRGIDGETASVAASCADGMLTKALKIAQEPEYISLYKSAINLLLGLKKSVDVLHYGTLSQIENGTEEFLNVLSILLRDIIAAKCGNEIISKHITKEINILAVQFSVRAASEIILLINEARKKLSLNVNPQAAIDSLLFSILEVKFKWQP